MQIDTPTLSTLFEQLGLKSDQASIDEFANKNTLPEDVKLVDAPFWTVQQASFLKTEMLKDASWATVVDELNALLHSKN